MTRHHVHMYTNFRYNPIMYTTLAAKNPRYFFHFLHNRSLDCLENQVLLRRSGRRRRIWCQLWQSIVTEVVDNISENLAQIVAYWSLKGGLKWFGTSLNPKTAMSILAKPFSSLLGRMKIWQSWPGKWAWWWNISLSSQPNPTIQGDGPPCMYVGTFSDE